MKRVIGILFCVVLLAAPALAAPVEATGPSAGPWPVPENGFWVIVTMESGPARTTVQYFDLQRRLLAEERIEGVRLDGRSKRVCRMLNKKLQMALASATAHK